MSIKLFEEHAPEGYERLIRVEEAESGLRAFICIHSTACGPAAGGCRMWPYSCWEEARIDVLRLARGMTAKNAIAGLGLGGGKSVIIGDARVDKSEALLRAFGQAVNALSGLYYTAEDVGMSPADMRVLAEETHYAVGLESGKFGSGDPSPFTAEGVFQCLKVGAKDVFGTEAFEDRRILVQGLGHVGMALAQKLHRAGAKLIVSDINQEAVIRAHTHLHAEVCEVDDVFQTKMDIFAPCALGGILTHETAGQISAKLICGAANNQLKDDDVAQTLRARGIRYLPDFVVNAGGIISVAMEIHREGPQYRDERLNEVAKRIADILQLSDSTGRSTTSVTNDVVDAILKRARDSKLRETA